MDSLKKSAVMNLSMTVKEQVHNVLFNKNSRHPETVSVLRMQCNSCLLDSQTA